MGHTHHLEPERPLPGFILADHRTDSTFEQIPIIDFMDATSDDPAARRKLSELIRDACINIGFFYMKNHGIPDGTIAGAAQAADRFFSSATELKMNLDIHKSDNFKGYTALMAENTNPVGLGDLHEGFDIGWEGESTTETPSHMGGPNVWPDEVQIPGFKSSVLSYYHAAVKLGQSLFPMFALALDLPETFFDDKTTKPAAIMRLLRYPPQHPSSVDADDRVIGIGTHTDYECFTILWQDAAGGLQVQNAQGTWIKAVPIPGTLVINLGDQFARWTNDVFKSTPHRAINRSGQERFSIPLFFGTDYDVPLEPLPGCVTPDNPAKYDVVTAGEYVKSRLEATYSHSSPTRFV